VRFARARGRYYREKHRLFDVVRDVWDRRVRGYCAVQPDEDSGGYRHWRCGRSAGHPGRHRYRNYVWAGPGERVEYDPAPPQPSLGPVLAPRYVGHNVDLRRYGTVSRRQEREKREKLDRLAREREARRGRG
jgi:hypothetical protein